MSPCRPSLYRKGVADVIFIAAIVLGIVLSGPCFLRAQGLVQHGKRPAETGPRAVGLVQLSTSGKGRLIPIVIMVDGKFYDAGSYKATPVPMALDFGIIYEAFQSGVSQGLLTITQPGQLNHNWIAEGTWLPAGAVAQQKTKKYTPPVIDDDNKDDRPVLHRRPGSDADKGKSDSKPATNSTTVPSTAPSSAPPAGSSPQSTPSTSTPSSSTTASGSGSKDTAPAAKDSTKSASESKSTTAKASDLDQPIDDPNRPVLRRGKPDPNARHDAFVTFDEAGDLPKPAPAKSASKSGVSTPSVQTFAAVSDAKGPDPRPYTYDVKPTEEAIYRNKMLDLAATLVKLGPHPAADQQKSTSTTSRTGRVAPKKPASPRDEFQDVNLHLFDLSNSNEPVLVLSAQATPPAGTSGSQIPQEITLIARTNLEGDLQKLFFAQTDARHLDVSPRMELIDAVDADGDGRGELLFRRTFDDGSAYAIYRVTADQLWPLYEGTP
jgi:hypothetical protein